MRFHRQLMAAVVCCFMCTFCGFYPVFNEFNIQFFTPSWSSRREVSDSDINVSVCGSHRYISSGICHW